MSLSGVYIQTARGLKKSRDPQGRAMNQVARAIKEGELARPNICDNCGDADWWRLQGKTVRISAHHTDYRKPLDVEWLCDPCHRAADKERRQKEQKDVDQWYVPQ